MRRARTWIIILGTVAVVAGIAWMISELKIELRVVPYGDEPAPAPSSTDPVLTGIGLALVALAAAAVAFTAWAVVKQILLIRRGRPDSR